MKKVHVFMLLAILWISACAKPEEATPVPTETEVPPPTRTTGPTPTPRELQGATPTATQAPTLTFTVEVVEEVPTKTPDMSSVTLHLVTRLEENQSYLQISMNGWPEDMPENFDVRVGLEIYECEKLFPERYPNRMYCWGIAPRAGSAVVLQVFIENVARSILDIPFRVPYIIRETEEN